MSRSSSPIDRHHRKEVIAKRRAWFVGRAPDSLGAGRVQGNRQNLFGEQLAHPYACASTRKAAIGRLLAQRQGTMSRSSSPFDRHHRREVIAKRCAWFVQRAPAPLVASRGAGESTKPLRRASCAPLCLREGEESSDGQVARTEAGDDVSFIQSHRQASSPGGHCKATRMVCATGSCSSGRK